MNRYRDNDFLSSQKILQQLGKYHLNKTRESVKIFAIVTTFHWRKNSLFLGKHKFKLQRIQYSYIPHHHRAMEITNTAFSEHKIEHFKIFELKKVDDAYFPNIYNF